MKLESIGRCLDTRVYMQFEVVEEWKDKANDTQSHSRDLLYVEARRSRIVDPVKSSLTRRGAQRNGPLKRLLLPKRLTGGAKAGPGRVADAGLQQSMPTREPNLDPRRETMCFLW